MPSATPTSTSTVLPRVDVPGLESLDSAEKVENLQGESSAEAPLVDRKKKRGRKPGTKASDNPHWKKLGRKAKAKLATALISLAHGKISHDDTGAVFTAISKSCSGPLKPLTLLLLVGFQVLYIFVVLILNVDETTPYSAALKTPLNEIFRDIYEVSLLLMLL